MLNGFSKYLEYPGALLKLIIIASALLISLLLGVGSTDIPYKWAFAGIGAVLFVIIAILNMPMALTLLIAISVTVNITIGTGSSTPLPIVIPITVLLIVVWFMRMIVKDHRISLIPLSINKPFILFFLAIVISWLVGYVIWDWRITAPGNLLLIQIGQIALFVLSIGISLLVANQLIQKRYLKYWAIIIICIGYIIIIPRILGQPSNGSDQLIGGMFMWPFLFLWGQLLFNPRLKPWMRITGFGLSLIWVYWVYFIAFVWKGGWLPAVLGLCFMMWFKNKKVFVFLTIFAILFMLLNWSYIDQHFLSGEVQSGSTIRPLFWWDVIRMTLRSPIFGLGPANYKFYWQDPSFIPMSRLSYGWNVWDAWGYSPPSHNTFVDIFSQTGIIGLGLFLWGLIAALIICYRTFLRTQPGFIQAYIISVLCGFASMCVTSFVMADFLIPFVYNITVTGFRGSVYSWLLLGSVLGLQNSTSNESEQNNV